MTLPDTGKGENEQKEEMTVDVTAIVCRTVMVVSRMNQ